VAGVGGTQKNMAELARKFVEMFRAMFGIFGGFV